MIYLPIITARTQRLTSKDVSVSYEAYNIRHLTYQITYVIYKMTYIKKTVLNHVLYIDCIALAMVSFLG